MSLPILVEANIIQYARNYTGERFHGILSDPPYALISIAKRLGKPGSAPVKEGRDGSFARLSKGFMGQTWDSFESLDEYRDWVKVWAKYMIGMMLYPGAVCLFFGGTRTWHHLAVALEAGGFEIYDTLMWLYGSGFPKSHDISKGIDRAAGAEREITGTRDVPGYARANVKHGTQERSKYEFPEYSKEPMTDDAETWQGYGTALKPAWEPIFLCRAPRGDLTHAELAELYGTGGLDIGGSRIGAGGDKMEGGHAGKTPIHGGGITGRVGTDQSVGRWPANLLLTHHEDCVELDSTRVPARVINRWRDGAFPFGGAGGLGIEYQSEQMGDDEGMEIFERWACAPECALRGLGPEYRYFYSGKANPTEKHKGLENFYWARVEDGFERIPEDDWRCLPEDERAEGNIHPTVKPLGLLRYLAGLFKPPETIKSRLLVPFSGSGSEVIAGHQAGWAEAVGVEISPLYNEIAEARMAGTLGML